ncbi:hypothetical protein B0H13DRAFT_2430149 [Mycena leptocephala]|nr:hypothetical protein B0H13DRAFT_2430149 [Mycena leptocephala]
MDGSRQDLIVAVQNVFTTRYVSAAGYVVLLYDHLLTLDLEVEYIWSAPNTSAKILFLIMRYMVPLFLTGETITRNGLSVIPMSDVPQSPDEAAMLISFLGAKSGTHSRYRILVSFLAVVNVDAPSQTYAGWFSINISNFLVLLRIWATLPRGHRLIAWSLAFFITVQLANFGVTSWTVSNMIPVFFYDPAAGFCSFSSKPNVAGLFLPGLIFEVVVFVTVCWNVLDRPRALGTDPESYITCVFFRDGMIYFVVLTVLRVANVVLSFVAPVSLIFVAVYFIWAATTITTSRLIINLRQALGKAERRREQRMIELEIDQRTSERHRRQSTDEVRR